MRRLICGLFVAVLGCRTVSTEPGGPRESGWVTAWAAAMQEADEPVALDGVTIREVVRVTLDGTALRLRLSNRHGKAPLRLGAVRVARSAGGARCTPGSDHPVGFGGTATVTVPAGGEVVSDEVPLPTAAADELAVSLFLPDSSRLETEHSIALETSFVSAPGDRTKEDFEPARELEVRPLLTAVEVRPRVPGARAIAVLGDSLTDGVGTPKDARERWVDRLAGRLGSSGTPAAVLNLGIAGNRLLHDFLGERGLGRLSRDALERPGVKTVVLELGLNDLGLPTAFPEEARNQVVEVDTLAGGVEEVIQRAHRAGIRVVGVTLPPCEGAKMKGYCSAELEVKRRGLNAWLRGARELDGLLDFDLVLRDPEHPERLRREMDSGDHLHPNAAGAAALADSVDLATLR